MTVFAPGDMVRVRDDWPEARGRAHIRTPHYVRGRSGVVHCYLGAFPNPEDLAFGRAACVLELYHVRFDLPALWGEAREGDDLLVELFAPWLDAVS
jgi:nitrile hydratase